MRERLLVVAALAAIAAAAAAAAWGRTPEARAPARVQVVATEFALTLSRPSIKAGPAIVQLANFGEDAHDLKLRRRGGTRTYSIPAVRPGNGYDLSAKLLPGRFTLWCSIADHRARGMVATLVVRS